MVGSGAEKRLRRGRVASASGPSGSGWYGGFAAGAHLRLRAELMVGSGAEKRRADSRRRQTRR